jgi:hypothetical protein
MFQADSQRYGEATKRKEEQCCQVNILGIVTGLVFWASEGGHAAEAIS